VLQTASLIAAEDKDEDGIPMIRPVSCGRDGEAPIVIRLPTLRAEAVQIVELLSTAHQEGHAWGDMAILCRRHQDMYLCANVLNRRRLPHQVRDKLGQFDPAADTIKVLTLHASKGLEFPVVAMVGVGLMPSQGEDERDEARLFYVGATRATHRLIIGLSGGGQFATRLA
jgi:superfamily I DNA/RNA helicase